MSGIDTGLDATRKPGKPGRDVDWKVSGPDAAIHVRESTGAGFQGYPSCGFGAGHKIFFEEKCCIAANFGNKLLQSNVSGLDRVLALHQKLF
ncbi:hypothetical protein [Kerstersia gyiorum]|uniref:hypothetical protein n=1 Tax=Kerstersia gyiorum TaxID=206506 RepID=UPI0020A01208|nr:hypothetical protein [Kerstersia gyiorum]MCP1632348.1 hypothetical protein [Kerstersia gyiorum]MCP1635145.1 hypothetical protein [Kerstersia gyiorum]MCP1669928.1 hypothetical protein [Kerstersia gyiorum]MCP1678068.1 hypothetical protein [Kerstersia gyiorum]MCP1680930.1 hypothetical protein [Kerstersia gyiorum]